MVRPSPASWLFSDTLQKCGLLDKKHTTCVCHKLQQRFPSYAKPSFPKLWQTKWPADVPARSDESPSNGQINCCRWVPRHGRSWYPVSYLPARAKLWREMRGIRWCSAGQNGQNHAGQTKKWCHCLIMLSNMLGWPGGLARVQLCWILAKYSPLHHTSCSQIVHVRKLRFRRRIIFCGINSFAFLFIAKYDFLCS